MSISPIASAETNTRRNLFIKYANSFMSGHKSTTTEPVEKAFKANPEPKEEKVKGIETLTIFPKQVIEGKTIITA